MSEKESLIGKALRKPLVKKSKSHYNPEIAKIYREKHKEKRRKQRREWYIKNKEWCLEYAKKYAQQHEEEIKKRMKEWSSRNWKKILDKKIDKFPEKYQARRLINNKIKIPIGQICSICDETKAVHKHHPDYSKPLEVIFVCRKCHNKIHKGDKK